MNIKAAFIGLGNIEISLENGITYTLKPKEDITPFELWYLIRYEKELSMNTHIDAETLLYRGFELGLKRHFISDEK